MNKKFWADGLSVDETKVSVLMLAFVVTLGFSLWQAVTQGDISMNLLALLGYEIMAVAGINVAEKVVDFGEAIYDGKQAEADDNKIGD